MNVRKIKIWQPLQHVRDYRVDVLVPVYNHERSLEMCLGSVLSQDHENVFITVIDDSSTDSSWAIAKSFEKRFPERIVAKKTERNRGSARLARQECGFQPSGHFWAVIEGDDWWLRESKISEQIALIHSNPSCVGASGTTIQVDANGVEIDRIRPNKQEWDYLDWVSGEPFLFVHISSILWKNVFVGREGFLPTLLDGKWPADDWPLTLACLAETGGSLRHLDELVSQYNFNNRGVWSGLEPETRNEQNDSFELALRKLVPFRYKVLWLWAALSGGRVRRRTQR